MSEDPNRDNSGVSNPTGLPGIRLGQTLWKGGQRPGQWTPPNFLQTYGNYTGLFPSLGQQVGQALHGSIQAQSFTPQWAQSVLPPHPSSSQVIDRAQYNPFLGQVPDPVKGGYTARPESSRKMQIGTPYVMNGRVPADQRNIGYISNSSNPFIGGYQGLTGYQGGQTQPKGQPTGQPTGGGSEGKNPGQTKLPGMVQQLIASGQISPKMIMSVLGLLGGGK